MYHDGTLLGNTNDSLGAKSEALGINLGCAGLTTERAAETARATRRIPPQGTMGTFDESDRPRVLWKSSIVLQDGTSLPGITISTYLQPWEPLSGKVHNTTEEAEAELCLAIQMVRHAPLRVSRIARDDDISHELDIFSVWEATGSIYACVLR